MSKEMIIFLYDKEYSKREDCDPLLRIQYFHPLWVSDQQKVILVGHLMGMMDCLSSIFAQPKTISLQNGIFSFKRFGRFVLAVGSEKDLPDYIIIHHIEILTSIIKLFHCDLTILHKKSINFKEKLSHIFEVYLPLLQYGSNIYGNAILLPLPVSHRVIISETLRLLKTCQQIEGVLGGMILFRNKVVATQLSNDLTKTLIFIEPYRIKTTGIHLEDTTGLDVPENVKLIKIYIDAKEYELLKSESQTVKLNSTDFFKKFKFNLKKEDLMQSFSENLCSKKDKNETNSKEDTSLKSYIKRFTQNLSKKYSMFNLKSILSNYAENLIDFEESLTENKQTDDSDEAVISDFVINYSQLEPSYHTITDPFYPIVDYNNIAISKSFKDYVKNNIEDINLKKDDKYKHVRHLNYLEKINVQPIVKNLQKNISKSHKKIETNSLKSFKTNKYEAFKPSLKQNPSALHSKQKDDLKSHSFKDAGELPISIELKIDSFVSSDDRDKSDISDKNEDYMKTDNHILNIYENVPIMTETDNKSDEKDSNSLGTNNEILNYQKNNKYFEINLKKIKINEKTDKINNVELLNFKETKIEDILSTECKNMAENEIFLKNYNCLNNANNNSKNNCLFLEKTNEKLSEKVDNKEFEKDVLANENNDSFSNVSSNSKEKNVFSEGTTSSTDQKSNQNYSICDSKKEFQKNVKKVALCVFGYKNTCVLTLIQIKNIDSIFSLYSFCLNKLSTLETYLSNCSTGVSSANLLPLLYTNISKNDTRSSSLICIDKHWDVVHRNGTWSFQNLAQVNTLERNLIENEDIEEIMIRNEDNAIYGFNLNDDQHVFYIETTKSKASGLFSSNDVIATVGSHAKRAIENQYEFILPLTKNSP